MKSEKTPIQLFLSRPGREAGNIDDLAQSLSLTDWNSQIKASWAGGRSDQIVEKILDLDRAMSIGPAVSPALGTAHLSQLVDSGKIVASEAFADMPEILNGYVDGLSEAVSKFLSPERALWGTRSIASEMNSKWSQAAWKAEHARSTLRGFGFTADESEALMTQAFVSTGLDIVSALPESDRLFALAGLNMLDTTCLNSNAIALELCCGTFGAERFRLSSDPIRSGPASILYGRTMSAQDCRLTDLGDLGIGSLLDGLERRWDASGSQMDEVSQRKVAALLDLNNEIAIAFGEARADAQNPYSGKHPKITVAVEHGLISAASEIGVATPRSWNELGTRISRKRSQEQAPEQGSSLRI